MRYVLSLLLILIAQTALAEEVQRFVRYALDGKSHYGLLEGDKIVQLSGPPFARVEKTGQNHALDAVKLLPPSEPSKVIAVGLNYRSHAGMSGAAEPALFAKLPSSLVGQGDPIRIPKDAGQPHYEGELVLIIGRRAQKVGIAEAPDYIFAVTAGNDVSERGWQGSDLQWLRAKASDTFGPVGPVMVRGLDYNDLLLKTRVNGEVQQSERTKMLIHSAAAIVSFASRYFTLEPGDMIFTGTPGRTSGLKAGDVVEITIEGVGTLRNPVVRE